MKVLITTGPTRAYLDDFRFLSNYSSGEMGYELARAFKKSRVALVAGVTSQPFKKLKLEHYSEVVTNREMHAEVLRLCRVFKPDWVILSAAVLDFEPAVRAKGKVSSKKSAWNIRLKPAPKIIDDVRRKFPQVGIVAFKLEPHLKNKEAAVKLGRDFIKRKKVQAVVVNALDQITPTQHPAWLVTSAAVLRTLNKKQTAKGTALLCE